MKLEVQTKTEIPFVAARSTETRPEGDEGYVYCVTENDYIQEVLEKYRTGDVQYRVRPVCVVFQTKIGILRFYPFGGADHAE